MYSDWLRAGRSGDRIPVGGEISRTCPDRPWGPSSLLYNGYRVFPWGKERPGRDAYPSPLLEPWSRKSRAIPLLPLRVVRALQSLSACTRVHFTFYLYRTLAHVAFIYQNRLIKEEVLFHRMLPDFRKSPVIWKVPKYCP